MAALAVSFWHLCLENIPDGQVTRRRLTAEETRARIEKAQKAGQLLCVSKDDLLAPYKKHALEKHRELCDTLAQQHAIDLPIRRFFMKTEEGEEASYTITPLGLVEVSAERPLLVVTCQYTFLRMDADAEGPPRFPIAPESIAFHLIERR